MGGLALRSAEMQDVAVLPEHVDLLYARDRLHVQLLERALELLVVLRVCGLRFAHDLSPHGALPACTTGVSGNGQNLLYYTAAPLNGSEEAFLFFFGGGEKG